MQKRNLVALASVLVLCASPAQANVTWPAALLEGRSESLPVIAADLVVEWLFIYFGLRLDWKKATIVDVTINAASALIGMVVIPTTGMLFVFRTSELITWATTYVLAVAITTTIEVLVANLVLILMKCRRDVMTIVMIILAANAISVGIAFASLIIYPYSTRFGDIILFR